MLTRDLIYGDPFLPQLEAALRAITHEATDALGLPQSIKSRPWTPVKEVGVDTAIVVGAVRFKTWTTQPEESRPDYRSKMFIDSQAPQLYGSKRSRQLFNKLLYVVEADRRLVCRSGLSWRRSDPPEEDRPAIFLHSIVVPFLIEYLALARPCHFDEEAFGLAFASIEMDLPSPLDALRLVTPLANVWLSDEALDVAPGIRLKRVTRREIERWLNMKTDARLSLGYVPEEELLTVQCALEVTAEGIAYGRLESPIGETVTEQMIAVLRLLLSHRVFPVLTDYRVLGLHWTTVGYRHHWAPGYRFDIPIGLDGNEGRRLARLFSGIRVGRNRHAARLALRRWSNAWDRARTDDALIDHWVALESLFVPEGSTSIKWLASARAAAFLEQDEDSLRTTFSDMTMSYRFRSDIVHADRKLEALPTDAMEQVAATTANYLRRSLTSVLEKREYFSPRGLEATVAAFEWASIGRPRFRTRLEYVQRIRRCRANWRLGRLNRGRSDRSSGDRPPTSPTEN